MDGTHPIVRRKLQGHTNLGGVGPISSVLLHEIACAQNLRSIG